MGGYEGDPLREVDGCDIGMDTKIAKFVALYDCEIGDRCRIWRFVNAYGATVGDNCMLGSFVELQSDVSIGDGTRVQSHAFVCSLVYIGEEVFISHGAKFVNDRYPQSGEEADWEATTVGDGAVIGTNATLLPVNVGEDALVGAGAVVTEDVPPGAIVVGNPATVVGHRDEI